MNWTDQHPVDLAAEGFYWWRPQVTGPAEIVLVTGNRHALSCYRNAIVAEAVPIPVELMGGQWCGPIMEPK